MSYDYGKCHACGEAMEEQMTDCSIQEADEWLVVSDVPTGVCTRCGEKIFRWQVAQRLEEIVKGRRQARPTTRIEVPVFAF